MVKSTEVKNDSEKLSLYLTDYSNRFEALQSDWKGVSYNKLKEKADAFAKNANNIIKMMEYLATVCECYETLSQNSNNTSNKKKNNKKALETEELFYDIQDLENISIGSTNFVGKRYFAPTKLIIKSKKENTKETFRLNTDIINSNFRTTKKNVEQLRTKILSYDVSTGTTDFEVKLTNMIKKIANNLQTCINRIQNTITAIEAVVDNHIRLQENLVKYIRGEDEEEEDSKKTFSPSEKETTEKKADYKKSSQEDAKKTSSDSTTTDTDKKVEDKEKVEEETIVEAQLPETQVPTGGYGGYQQQVEAAPVEEPQPEVEVPVSTVPAATTPRVIKAQTKNNGADATAIIPLAGIGLVGAAGGVALLAKKKKEEEEEAEYLEDEEIEETEFNNNKKQQRSSRENKEWLHSLGLGISDDIDSSTIENDSVSMGANN